MSFQRHLSASLLLVMACAAGARAQGAGARPAQPPAQAETAGPAILAVAPQASAPQVVTVVHRLSGLKLLRLLRRSEAQASGVNALDADFAATKELHTSFIAGLTLGDGRTIVSRIPQAEAEVETPTGFPLLATPPPLQVTMPALPSPKAPPAIGPIMAAPPALARIPDDSDLMIVGRDGRKVSARYVGLDGLTGLSLLQVVGEGVARPTREAREDKLYVGQSVRLLAPLRVTENRSNRQQQSGERVYLRVAELRGRLTEIKRVGEEGRIAGLTVRALNLSPEIAGGIALNEAGETIGIVEASESGEARIMPAALVRKAAERVLARRASVPRPWLGVRGDALEQLSVESLTSLGWQPERAASLLGKREGIFLTSVAAGTPAALANLHPGDIILSVNDAPVKSADDFTFMLNEAGGGASVRFTLLQPDQISPRAVSVTLSETLNPLHAMDMSETAAATRVVLDPLVVHGVETLTISKQVAARFGASGGSLLVLSVSPGSSAAIAGLRSGDVVEAIDGNGPGATGFALPPAPSKQTTLTVVRHKQKITLTLIPDSGVHQR